MLPKGTEGIEVVTLLATLADLFLDNRRIHGGAPHGTALAGTVVGTRSAWGDLAERLINELGLGVRDEGLFLLKLRKLSQEDREVIDDMIAEHDKRIVNRLRIVAVNVPNPPPQKIKGKRERKDKDGKVVEEGEPDKEIPSDIDNGVEFLKSLSQLLRGKNKEEQTKALESLNLTGKAQYFAAEAGKVAKEKVIKLLGLSKDTSAKEVIERVEKFIKGIKIPDPTEPRPKDTAGWFVRFMRSITPGSFPNN